MIVLECAMAQISLYLIDFSQFHYNTSSSLSLYLSVIPSLFMGQQ